MEGFSVNFNKYLKVREMNFYKKLGKVVNVVGLTIESLGPDAKLADLCKIMPEDDDKPPILAEVVGFKDSKTLLMPYNINLHLIPKMGY